MKDWTVGALLRECTLRLGIPFEQVSQVVDLLRQRGFARCRPMVSGVSWFNHSAVAWADAG